MGRCDLVRCFNSGRTVYTQKLMEPDYIRKVVTIIIVTAKGNQLTFFFFNNLKLLANPLKLHQRFTDVEKYGQRIICRIVRLFTDLSGI